jgi:hypothetical protein
MRTDRGACRCCRGLAAARSCGCSAAAVPSRPSSMVRRIAAGAEWRFGKGTLIA